MSNLFLSSGVNFILNNSDVTVFGAGGTGNEAITLGAGVTGLRIDQNVERVTFSAATSAFTYQQQGISLVVYSGTTIVATLPLQADANGTQLTFTNGTVNVTVGASGMLFGGTAVPAGLTSAQAAPVTPTAIDSSVASATSPTIPVAPGSGSSIDNGSTLQTLNAASGAFDYTDDASRATNVVITGFTSNDRISVTGATVDQYSFSTGDAGRDLVITFNNTAAGVVNSIVLDDVLVGNSTFIFDFATARTALGFDFFRSQSTPALASAAGGTLDVDSDGSRATAALFSAATGNVSFTEDALVANFASITNFTNGDTITVSNTTVSTYAFTGVGTDIRIDANVSGVISTIVLINANPTGAFINSEASAEAAFGADFFRFASAALSTTMLVPGTASTIDNGSALSMLNAATGSFNYTDDAARQTNVVITGFTNNDLISVTGATAAQYSFTTGDAGRDLVITFSNVAAGVINNIVLDDVLVGSSVFIFDYATARTALSFDFMVFG